MLWKWWSLVVYLYSVGIVVRLVFKILLLACSLTQPIPMTLPAVMFAEDLHGIWMGVKYYTTILTEFSTKFILHSIDHQTMLCQ